MILTEMRGIKHLLFVFYSVVTSMSVSTLIGLCAYFFALLIMSAFMKLVILGMSYIRFHRSKDERKLYEDRFRRIAEEAMNGQLLLEDLRDPDVVIRQPKKARSPVVSTPHNDLADLFNTKFA